MKILFIGQQGIPAHRSPGNGPEERVEQLAARLVREGHTVTVACTKPYGSSTIRNLQGVQLKYVPTFDPHKTGGFLPLMASLLMMWRTNPDVVHMHGWLAAALVRLAALTCPHTTFIWTVSMPKDISLLTRFISWQARSVFDAIISPTRELQYQFLNTLHVRTRYIPDGYGMPLLSDIPASQWGLRRGQYCVTTATSLHTVVDISKAYELTKTRKKLVILLYSDMPGIKRLQRKYPFLLPIVASSPRARMSLVRQAATFVVTEQSVPASLILSSMDAGCPVVAVNHSLPQELVGTTGLFAKSGSVEDMAQVLEQVVFYPTRQKQMGAAARKRAQAHFQWDRIVEEYLTAYHYPEVRLVPLDSLHSPILRKAATL